MHTVGTCLRTSNPTEGIHMVTPRSSIHGVFDTHQNRILLIQPNRHYFRYMCVCWSSILFDAITRGCFGIKYMYNMNLLRCLMRETMRLFLSLSLSVSGCRLNIYTHKCLVDFVFVSMVIRYNWIARRPRLRLSKSRHKRPYHFFLSNGQFCVFRRFFMSKYANKTEHTYQYMRCRCVRRYRHAIP